MRAILLDVLYLGVCLAASPWLLYRLVIQRKPIAGLRTKLTGNIVRQHPGRPCVWFHAVSVGEVLQLQSLVAEFAARHPDHEVLITTTTGTGFDVARQKFPDQTVAYWPLDFSWAVGRALRHIQPSQIVLVELELWPNFLLAAKRRNTPVVLVNGRISEKSFRGYRRAGTLLRPLWASLSHVAAQTDEYGARFRQLGVPANRLTVTGNIKFDRVQSDRRNARTEELRTCFQLSEDDVVFIAGSTQDPEERLAIEAYLALRQEFPALRLILVPRHKERFEEVAQLVRSFDLPLLRRSEMQAEQALTSAPQPVRLLDTLGELAACWGLADVAFVGGSLTQRGGQNMLEPAGYGAAVLFGPNTWNFRDIVEQLLSREAARVVCNGDDLRDALRRCLEDPRERQRLGETARSFVLTQQGATAKTLQVLEAAATPRQTERRAAA